MKTTRKVVNHRPDKVSGEIYEGETFFFIWNPASDFPPTVMFQNYTDAHDAAKRLAEKVPGEDFYVSKAVQIVTVPIKAKTKVLK